MSEGAILAVDPAPAAAPVLGRAGGVPLWTKTGFAAGDFAFNLYWSGTALFLLYFYTDVLGIAPVMAGLIYFTALFWDAVLDPVMGVIADRTRTRFGRYRPYVLLGAVPLALAGVLAYVKPALSGTALVGWAFLTHCLLRTAYTVVNIPYRR